MSLPKLAKVAEVLAVKDQFIGANHAAAEDYLRLIRYVHRQNSVYDIEWGYLYAKAKNVARQMPRDEGVLWSWAACLRENILAQTEAVWVFQMSVWGTLLVHNTVSQQAKDVLMVVQTAFGIPDFYIDTMLLMYPFAI